MIRALISDDSETSQKFSDDQIMNLVVTAARYVLLDAASLGFAFAFVASVQNQTITPDPTAPASLDDSFLYLITAKAACLIAQGAAFKAAGQSLRIKSRDDELDLKEGYKARLAVSAESCKDYRDLMARYLRDRRAFLGGTQGYAVVTPVRLY